MNENYTREHNAQILLRLLKEHQIRKIIVSPGTTNIAITGSVQNDNYFEVYSAPDERSAAYMACGMAAECQVPVVLSCTGATASRNYIPGLTEAFYRKLPILAITSTPPTGRVGNYFPQQLDRSQQLNDIANLSVQIPIIHNEQETWEVNTKINNALLELRRKTGGPVHINLETECNPFFDVEHLSETRVIKRIEGFFPIGEYPLIDCGKVAVYVGSHLKWNQELTDAVDEFCEKYNSVVLIDHTSNYPGKYGVMYNLIGAQECYNSPLKSIKCLIDIGSVSGAYMAITPEEVWRVNPDGEIRDRFQKTTFVFEMDEVTFFRHYDSLLTEKSNMTLFPMYVNEYRELYNRIEELPFSNIWIAKELSQQLPAHSVIHLGILNSLRAWDFFETDKSITAFSNTGGFGIDGCVSSLIGASIAVPNKLFFGVVGDLAFFYDMNSLGNRHVGNNVRLLVVNNGKGTEFRNYSHNAARFGERADSYIAASGHYGNQSHGLIKHYAEDLGFEYICAQNKYEFEQSKDIFLSPEVRKKTMIFEVFTDSDDESNALYAINHLIEDAKPMQYYAKKLVSGIIGDKGIQTIKKIIG